MVIHKTNHYINLETLYGANNYAPLDVVITKGQGVWVEDVMVTDTWTASSPIQQSTDLPPKI